MNKTNTHYIDTSRYGIFEGMATAQWGGIVTVLNLINKEFREVLTKKKCPRNLSPIMFGGPCAVIGGLTFAAGGLIISGFHGVRDYMAKKPE